MDTEKSNYTIGLSRGVRERKPADVVCGLIDRALDGDPGDSDDINHIMNVVSAHMDNMPCAHLFKAHNADEPPIVVLLQPREHRLLVVGQDEIDQPEMIMAIESFGFNGDTLEPL
jgi:hypothetical protein